MVELSHYLTRERCFGFKTTFSASFYLFFNSIICILILNVPRVLHRMHHGMLYGLLERLLQRLGSFEGLPCVFQSWLECLFVRGRNSVLDAL